MQLKQDFHARLRESGMLPNSELNFKFQLQEQVKHQNQVEKKDIQFEKNILVTGENEEIEEQSQRTTTLLENIGMGLRNIFINKLEKVSLKEPHRSYQHAAVALQLM